MGLTLWAKSPPPESPSVGYPLLPHLLDVAAVADRLQQLIPCPATPPCSPQWIAALVGAHDFGKATPGFQRKLGQNVGSGFAGAPDRHDASTVPLLIEQLCRLGVDRESATAFAQVVAAHHGNLIPATEVASAGRWRFTPQWQSEHKALFSGLLKGSGAMDHPQLPDAPSERAVFLQWLMGLTTVSDWIGSSDAVCRWDRLSRWDDDSPAWFAASLELAEQALLEVGITAQRLHSLPSGSDALALALDGRSPRPLQCCTADLVDQLAGDTGLIVIEAPMGEGKTEAALALSAGRGLYVAMPTQATSNALFTRVSAYIARAGAGEAATVALAHGAGGPAAAATRLKEVGLGTEDSGITAGWWFRGSKRALLCPHGIGTVDQALIGVLNTRHAFVRLFGLCGRTVIFDEVHAYDSYTSGLIERLVIWLQNLGSRVVVMSATLPAARRQALLGQWVGETPITDGPYPRVTLASKGQITVRTFAASRRQHLALHGIEPDGITAAAQEMALQGARVLVVVNKVRRAQELFQQIATQAPASLFHARFPMDQRLLIENSVLQRFGPNGSGDGGCVLVATQVAEQSLDIDMDVLLTDIAPVDLVLQRAGRIHRHQRVRPAGFEAPVVFVAGILQAVPPDDLTSYVYDRWLVLRSAAWLQSRSLLNFPEDIDLAVQQVYGGWQPDAAPVPLQAAIAAALPEHQHQQRQMEQWSEQAALPTPLQWAMHHPAAQLSDEQAESGAARFGTRLGEDSVSVVPVREQQLDALQEHSQFLSGHYLRVSDRRLLARVRAAAIPPGWRDQPGLRQHLPLLVDDGGAFSGGRLDPVLGLLLD